MEYVAYLLLISRMKFKDLLERSVKRCSKRVSGSLAALVVFLKCIFATLALVPNDFLKSCWPIPSRKALLKLYFPAFSAEYFCHYDQLAVEAEAQEIWVSAWHPNPPEDYYHSIMIHCPVPSFVEPAEIERILISEAPCDYSHAVMLNVTNTQQTTEENTKDFCVCLKPLDFPNEPRLASRLMEWIESNLQLGAQKIVIYVYSGTLA